MKVDLKNVKSWAKVGGLILLTLLSAASYVIQHIVGDSGLPTEITETNKTLASWSIPLLSALGSVYGWWNVWRSRSQKTPAELHAELHEVSRKIREHRNTITAAQKQNSGARSDLPGLDQEIARLRQELSDHLKLRRETVALRNSSESKRKKAQKEIAKLEKQAARLERKLDRVEGV